jgi:hypothetical protein
MTTDKGTARNRVGRTAVAVAMAFTVVLPARLAVADSPATPSCTPQASQEAPVDLLPQLSAICDVLVSLAAEAGTETAFTLVVETLRRDFLRAHLEWTGPAGPERGPSLDFGFLDTTLGPSQYRFVATGLLAATGLPPAPTADN